MATSGPVSTSGCCRRAGHIHTRAYVMLVEHEENDPQVGTVQVVAVLKAQVWLEDAPCACMVCKI